MYRLGVQTMPSTTSISANIPQELNDILNVVALAEERSKSYYIKKGLEAILTERLENLEDYKEAKEAYDQFIASGETSISLDKVFKHIE